MCNPLNGSSFSRKPPYAIGHQQMELVKTYLPSHLHQKTLPHFLTPLHLCWMQTPPWVCLSHGAASLFTSYFGTYRKLVRIVQRISSALHPFFSYSTTTCASSFCFHVCACHFFPGPFENRLPFTLTTLVGSSKNNQSMLLKSDS